MREIQVIPIASNPISQIRKGAEELVRLSEMNFILTVSPGSYPHIDKVICLVRLLNKILNLEISQVTPDNAMELYERVSELRELCIDSAKSSGHSFFEPGCVDADLYPVLSKLQSASLDLYHQSTKNVLQSIANHSKETPSVSGVKEICQKILQMQDAELKASLSTVTVEFLKAATEVDNQLLNSLAFQNKASLN